MKARYLIVTRSLLVRYSCVTRALLVRYSFVTRSLLVRYLFVRNSVDAWQHSYSRERKKNAYVVCKQSVIVDL